MKHLLISLGLVFFGSIPAMAIDSHYRIAVDQSSMIVVGNGGVQVMPDMASVSTKVSTKAKTAKEAQALNAKATKKLVDSLVAKFNMDKVKDISTSSYDVSPDYKQDANGNSVLVGYSVRHSISVQVRNITLLGAVIDHTGDNGGLVDSIQFGVSNKKPLEKEALKAAMADATQRAQIIAEANNRTLGRLVRVSEVIYNYEVPSHDMQEEEASEETEIYPDLVTVSARLTVEYEF